MPERAVGTVLQYAYEADDLPSLLRLTADSIEQLGPGAQVLDVAVRVEAGRADVYFLRVD
jgi:hypothetical protein